MSSVELAICILLVFTSGLLSSSEIALFSLSRFQLRYLRDHFSTAHKRIKRLLSDTSGLLITILVTNEVVNISLSTLITNSINRNWEDQNLFTSLLPQSFIDTLPHWALQTFAGLLVTTPIILFFCEITPKVTAARVNQLIAPMTSRPLLFAYIALKPLRLVLQGFIRFTSRLLGNQHPNSSDSLTWDSLKEEEFLMILEEGHKEGMIQGNELELIKNIFSLDDILVSDICTPLSQIYCLPSNLSVGEAYQLLKRRRQYRTPIFQKNRNHIVGILYTKDLILGDSAADQTRSRSKEKQRNELKISEVMRKPFSIHPKTNISRLLRSLRQNKIYYATVVDDSGSTIGIVTIDDILEEIFDDMFEDQAAARG